MNNIIPQNNELNSISQITDNLFISGVSPLSNSKEVKLLNINFIVCCVNGSNIKDIHKNIPDDTVILYIPYSDVTNQNLWSRNDDNVIISADKKYDAVIKKLLELYQGKTMIEIGYDFINKSIEAGGKVLVHCMAGISRSVSVVIYYIMKKYNVSFDKAYQLVTVKRSIANPNQSFRLQLKGYEEKRQNFTHMDATNIIKQKIIRA
jgi:protein-tyrosine phosphatase